MLIFDEINFFKNIVSFDLCSFIFLQLQEQEKKLFFVKCQCLTIDHVSGKFDHFILLTSSYVQVEYYWLHCLLIQHEQGTFSALYPINQYEKENKKYITIKIKE